MGQMTLNMESMIPSFYSLGRKIAETDLGRKAIEIGKMPVSDALEKAVEVGNTPISQILGKLISEKRTTEAYGAIEAEEAPGSRYIETEVSVELENGSQLVAELSYDQVIIGSDRSFRKEVRDPRILKVGLREEGRFVASAALVGDRIIADYGEKIDNAVCEAYETLRHEEGLKTNERMFVRALSDMVQGSYAASN